jgi:integrase
MTAKIAPAEGAASVCVIHTDAAQNRSVTFEETLRRYPGERRFLWRIADHFAGIPLRDITTDHLARGVAGLHPEAEASTLVREFWGPLRRFFKWAAAEGLCAPLHVPVPKLPRTPVPRILTAEEEERLVRELADHLRPFVMALASTGVPIQELRHLRWRRVDLHRGLIWFCRNGERIEVPLDRDVLAELRWLPHREGVVFCRPDGSPYSGRRSSCVDRSAFEAACRRAGLIGLTKTGVRYTGIARGLAVGRSVAELARITGNADSRLVARLARALKAGLLSP